jgi:rod shape-determining protein MreD
MIAAMFLRRLNRRINRVPSPTLAFGTPWVTVMLFSLAPILPIVASAPVMPPLGFMLLLAWRQVRPGLLPVWAGAPLGMFDDMFSGQPFGSAVLLWTLAAIVLDLYEARFPFRHFLFDWLVSSIMVCAYLALSLVFANAAGASASVLVIAPQALTSILLLPLMGRLVSALDRFRLLPFVEVG